MSVPMIEELALARAADLRRHPRGPLAAEVRRDRRSRTGHRWSLRRRSL